MVTLNEFSSYFGKFVSNKINEFYSFDHWRSLAIAQGDDEQAPASTYGDFEVLGDDFKVVSINTKSEEPSTEWSVPLFIEYIWTFKDIKLNIAVYIENGEFCVGYCWKITKALEDRLVKEFDLIREFDKRMTLAALQGK
ncbi:hypothetical protein ACQ5SP_15910 [Rhodovulum sp. YNF3179]|uniref:hypothetical protein n=1 Tax=Rhodovulum sp. YNF3179 TaxID=3425127 RepID=UPI003D345C69